jgi:outer membrane lipase/esterase
VKRSYWFTLSWLCLCLPAFSVTAAYTSFYVFGDGVCTTTNHHNPSLTNYYYGGRYSNGRTWIEVLAQRQGLSYLPERNWSYFGHYSRNLVTNVTLLTAPPDAGTSLFVIWVNNADFVDILADPLISYTSNNIAKWTNAMNASVSNHLTAVQTLYAKGVRTIVMPRAVDVTKAPYYDFGGNNESFVRQRIMDYNQTFTNRLLQLSQALSDLTIVIPDSFRLFDNLIQTPSTYGLTNVTSYALLELPEQPLWGAGTNFLFWDYLHPTAKVHEVVADTAQALLSRSRMAGMSVLDGDCDMRLVNLPIGLNGFVDGSTNLLNWTPLTSFESTNSTQSVLVPATQPAWSYRLRFPFAWSWP